MHHSDPAPPVSPQKPAFSPGARSSRLHNDGQEVRGGVFPAGLLPPHGFAVGVEAHEHVLLLVAPLSGGVGVVLVLLDAFDQAAVWTEVPLREEESTAKVSKQSTRR